MTVQSMVYHLSVYSISDVGLVRQNNEDAVRILYDEPLFLLADGMGGHLAGEVASRETVERLSTYFLENISRFHQGISQCTFLLKRLIQQVNEEVHRLSKSNPACTGMGTTLCCLYFHPEGLICAHVGDSRVYQWRKNKLRQITKDHSLLRELIDLGQLNEQQAGEFHYKNIITKAIGTENEIDPTMNIFSVEEEDIYMMCSDGLSDLVPFDVIEDLMNHHTSDEIAVRLVEQAKLNGGYDNISIVLVKVNKIHEADLFRL